MAGCRFLQPANLLSQSFHISRYIVQLFFAQSLFPRWHKIFAFRNDPYQFLIVKPAFLQILRAPSSLCPIVSMASCAFVFKYFFTTTTGFFLRSRQAEQIT